VNRRGAQAVIARGLAGLTAGTLGSRLARAADPAHRVVRVGERVHEMLDRRHERAMTNSRCSICRRRRPWREENNPRRSP